MGREEGQEVIKQVVDDSALWRALCDAELAFHSARQAFLLQSENRLATIRRALDTHQRGTALRVLPYLTIEERQQLFDDLVRLASVGHSDIELVRSAILSLPREWVLSRIESRAKGFLARGTEEEYRRFLELYSELEPSLTRRLATRAIQSEETGIREAGQDFLDWLERR